jgi:DNA replication protein DnaC
MNFSEAIRAAQRKPVSSHDIRGYSGAKDYKTELAGYKTKFQDRGYNPKLAGKNFEYITRFAASHRTLKLKKGLCIVGGNGRGKSMCTRILAKLRSFRFREAVEFNRRWKQADSPMDFWDWLEGSAQSPSGNDLVIDDLGRENQLNNFGTIETVMDRVLEHRIQMLHRIGAITVITTNCWVECPTDASGQPIPREDREYPTIVEHYGTAGERIKSRLYELCHIVRFTGPDQRRI